MIPHPLSELHEEKDGKENIIEFDFLGKDSIRYYNCVQVERQAFKNVVLFMRDKTEGDDLFDRLTVSSDGVASSHTHFPLSLLTPSLHPPSHLPPSFPPSPYPPQDWYAKCLSH